jgi:hypothetical protein
LRRRVLADESFAMELLNLALNFEPRSKQMLLVLRTMALTAGPTSQKVLTELAVHHGGYVFEQVLFVLSDVKEPTAETARWFAEQMADPTAIKDAGSDVKRVVDLSAASVASKLGTNDSELAQTLTQGHRQVLTDVRASVDQKNAALAALGNAALESDKELFRSLVNQNKNNGALTEGLIEAARKRKEPEAFEFLKTEALNFQGNYNVHAIETLERRMSLGYGGETMGAYCLQLADSFLARYQELTTRNARLESRVQSTLRACAQGAFLSGDDLQALRRRSGISPKFLEGLDGL